MLIFLGPNKTTDIDIVNLLGETIKTGIRKLFSVVNYEKLLLEVIISTSSILTFEYQLSFIYFI